jgi:hypothetical protein
LRILHNARIYTLEKARPLASVIALDHGEIVAVGGEELLREFEGAPRDDLGGRVVLPGLSDAHLHLKYYALALRQIDCETDTLAECLRRVGEEASRSAPGKWILGHGWNQNVWGAWPSAAELDGVAANNPVFLTAKSLHAAWANTAAMQLAGLQPGTADPPDGQIQRNATGEPTGILLEGAASWVSRLVPEPDLGGLADAIDQAQAELWKFGLTAVHDFDGRDCFMALQQLRLDGRLKLRVTKSIPVKLLGQAHDLGLRTGFGDDQLRIGSVKVFMDGALGPRTAAMFEPYESEPANKGILNVDGEQLFELGRTAVDIGLGMSVHAIGDRANHEALQAFEQLRLYEGAKHLPHLRHRIEHVQVIHPDDLGRLARLDVVASMQPLHATSDMLMADTYWGRRTAWAYAWKSHLETGAHVAFGSDAPVESPNPFWGIHAAITRRRADGTPGPQGWHPEQRISLQQALEGFTIGPAYAAYAENRQGSLARGKLADLVVLERDPFASEPDDLRSMRSSATMIGGDWVFRA